MSNGRFSPRQLRFLELFFSGYKMKDAARAAGYRGASAPALCNSGRKILNKLSKNPKALFYWPGAREMRIAQLIGDRLDSGTVQQQLKALKILARCLGD
ncbi:MAG: hypothetical protein NTY36_01010 [Deltaproteobacteria bacterium]|nr:hypothetical protein [Deltaproteobacteria bacterium]